MLDARSYALTLALVATIAGSSPHAAFGSPQDNIQQAETHFNQGVTKSKNKDYTGAIADYDRAIELNPRHANAYFNRGYARVELKDYPGGIADYTKAIELNPHHAHAYLNRGYTQAQLGHHKTAVQDYTKAIELQPGEPLAYMHRARAYMELNQTQAAFADYDRVVQLAPGDALGYVLRGNAYMEMNMLQNAVTDLEKAIRLDPSRRSALQPRIDRARQQMKEQKDRPKVEIETTPKLPQSGEGWPVSLLIKGGIWAADWNFEATTAIRQVKVTGQIVYLACIGLEAWVAEKFAIGALYEYGFGEDVSLSVGNLYGKYIIPMVPATRANYPEYIGIKGGLLVGRLQVESEPGSFDTPVGFMAGAEYKKYLNKNMAFDISAELRWLEFDFKPNSAAVTADSGIGGIGGTLFAGFSYTF